MTTIRVAKRRQFTVIDSAAINDDRLTFKARGLLVWLLSKPDDWRCDSSAIARTSLEGRHAIRTALVELEQCGYLERHKRHDKAGRFVSESIIHERPLEPTSVQFSDAGQPDVGSADAGQPDVGQPDAITSTEALSTDVLSTDETNTLALVVADAPPPDRFDEFYAAYPLHKGPKQARAAWTKALREATADEIIAGAHGYAEEVRRSRTEPRFIKHPGPWLNAGRWADERTQAPPGPRAPIQQRRDAPEGRVAL